MKVFKDNEEASKLPALTSPPPISPFRPPPPPLPFALLGARLRTSLSPSPSLPR